MGEQEFGGGRGNEQIFGWWWGFPPSPPVGKNLYVATANFMVYVLFQDHKPLVMYQSNYHQK